VALVPQGDARPMQLLGTALVMGYMYQGPPFRCGASLFSASFLMNQPYAIQSFQMWARH